jgi:hypothetical protein
MIILIKFIFSNTVIKFFISYFLKSSNYIECDNVYGYHKGWRSIIYLVFI